MSPRVQLVLYPNGDAAFASHAARALLLDLPDSYTFDEIVAAVEADLQAKYPLARIRIGVPADGEDMIWHVYRDGLSADGTSPH